MSVYDLSLLIGAVVVSLLSFRNPRGIVWVGAAMIDFWASHLYWDAGLPYAEAFTGACDATVCLAIYFFAREQWELWVWRLFQTSVAINFLYLAGNLGIFSRVDIDVYSILMEAVNWLVLLLIGGMAVGQLVGLPNAAARRPRDLVYRLVSALRSARKTPAFHKTK